MSEISAKLVPKPEGQSLDDFCTSFVGIVKESIPQVEHVMVIYHDKPTDQTTGIGNINGVKDMHRCLEILEGYCETLRAGIPSLN